MNLCRACQKIMVVTPISCCLVFCLESMSGLTCQPLTSWFGCSSEKRTCTPRILVKSSAGLAKGQSLNCHLLPCTKTHTTRSHSSAVSFVGVSMILKLPCEPSSKVCERRTVSGLEAPPSLRSIGKTNTLDCSSCCAFHRLTRLVTTLGTMMIELGREVAPCLAAVGGRTGALADGALCDDDEPDGRECGAVALAAASSIFLFLALKVSSTCLSTGKSAAAAARSTVLRVRSLCSLLMMALVAGKSDLMYGMAARIGLSACAASVDDSGRVSLSASASAATGATALIGASMTRAKSCFALSTCASSALACSAACSLLLSAASSSSTSNSGVVSSMTLLCFDARTDCTTGTCSMSIAEDVSISPLRYLSALGLSISVTGTIDFAPQSLTYWP
mmetsp:Transcript_15825/g.36199  ORF Transcript_15825/g.36199 Transcript_15825/m.36199 type:complete len:391 (-) Transcript_15825:242-1414(-)